jgi:hypothetical protein
MPSVIDFALAAPVVAQKHEVRVNAVDAANDGTATLALRRDPSDKWLANAADRTNALPIPRSSDSGHRREQPEEPRQHNPRTDNSDSRPLSPGSAYDDLNIDSGPQPSTLRYKSLSELVQPPIHDTPPPDRFPQISSSSNGLPSSSSRVATDSHALNPASPSDSRPLSVGSAYNDLNIDSGPQPSTLRYKPLSELTQTPTHDTPPLGGSPQISSSSDGLTSSSSWVATDSHSGSSGSTSEELYPSSPDHLSSAESHPPTPGPTDDQPPPTSSSNPGPSTEPSAKRPRPEDHDFGSPLSKILKGKFKRRISGSGALNAAQGDLQGTLNYRAYVTAFSQSLLSTNGRNQ